MELKHYDRLAELVAKIPNKYRANYIDWTLKQYIRLELGTICEEMYSDFDWDDWYSACEVLPNRWKNKLR